MKKLVVLILFMFMASVATAGYNPGWFITVTGSSGLEVDQDEIFTVTVAVGSSALTDFSGSEGSLAKMTITGGDVSNVLINAGAGWGPVPATPTATAISNVITIAAEIGTNSIAASTTLFTFTVTAPGANGTIVIDSSSGNWATFDAIVGEYDGYWTTVAPASYIAGTAGYAEILVVPEPMTLALLGLGGLLLRRRRKA